MNDWKNAIGGLLTGLSYEIAESFYSSIDELRMQFSPEIWQELERTIGGYASWIYHMAASEGPVL